MGGKGLVAANLVHLPASRQGSGVLGDDDCSYQSRSPAGEPAGVLQAQALEGGFTQALAAGSHGQAGGNSHPSNGHSTKYAP